MADVPQWAIERVHELSANGITDAFARYIASKEEPPVDPLMVAAREIVATTQHNWPDSPWHLNQVARLRVGAEDKSLVVMAAYEGIKRGMELAK